MSNLCKTLILIAAAALCGHCATLLSSDDAHVDSISVQETNKPAIKCAGARNDELAPESRVVAIDLNGFQTPLQYAPTAVPQKQQQLQQPQQIPKPLNKTSNKQSQDFEVHLTPAPTAIVDNTSTTTTTQSTSTSTTRRPATTTPAVNGEHEPDAQSNTSVPVASQISRQGAAVLCGEANAKGNSTKNLVPARIVGGRKTEPGEFPFQVRLNIRSRRGSGICGGVILDNQHILTAAHCMTACVSQHLTTVTIENSGVHATLGDHSIKSADGEIEVDIDKITPHEKYDACNFYANDHDIAIIKTATPFEYKFTTDGYGSVNRPCMPTTSVEYRDGEMVIVSGWGVTRENLGSLSNILRFVQVPIVNGSRCQETYGSRVTNEHICAGFQSGGKDSCQGDSGGPLVRVVDNRYELVGIVSFGYGCGQPGAPGVYTRVASYIDWINANL